MRDIIRALLLQSLKQQYILLSCYDHPYHREEVGLLWYIRTHLDITMYQYSRTARIASSNTVFSPFCVRAEHSRYFTAPMSLHIATPCWYWIGAIRLVKRMSARVTDKATVIPVFQLVDRGWVFTQIEFGADKNDRRLGCMM